MYQLKISAFPNGENRLVMSKLPSLRSAPVTDTLEPEVGDCEGVSGLPPPLTLALNSTPSDEIPKTRRQLGSFSLDARRKLLRAGGALARYDSSPVHCVFLTGTLPGGLHSAFRVMADQSARIVHRLKKWLAKRYSAHNFSFYCWELQKRGALHLHYLVYVPDDDARKRILSEFRDFWIDLLKSLSDETGVDLFERANGGTHRGDTQYVQAYAQECYKSVAAYMAKYIGKQAGKYSLEYAPKRWSGVSRPLGALIEEFTSVSTKVVPSYAPAIALYLKCKDDMWDESRKCYSYPHRVGVGNTTLVYYQNDKDDQSCQFNRVSQMMSSRNSVGQPVTQWKREVMIYYCNLRVLPLIMPHFPDWVDYSDNSGVTPSSILENSLMDAFMESQLQLSREALQSSLMAQLPFMLSVNFGTPITSTQVLYQNLLVRQQNLMTSRADLNLILELERSALRNVKILLQSKISPYNRSTTMATGYLSPEQSATAGGAGAVPEVVSVPPSLFDSFP